MHIGIQSGENLLHVISVPSHLLRVVIWRHTQGTILEINLFLVISVPSHLLRVAIWRHAQGHILEKKPFPRDQCFKTFSYGSFFKNPYWRKIFSCDQYPKSFGCGVFLKMHIRTHTGEKTFSCDQCPKSFGRFSLLKMYIRIHTGKKNFCMWSVSQVIC